MRHIAFAATCIHRSRAMWRPRTVAGGLCFAHSFPCHARPTSPRNCHPERSRGTCFSLCRSLLLIAVRPRNFAVRCLLLYFPNAPALPFTMVAPVPAHVAKLSLPLRPLCLPAQAGSTLHALCVELFPCIERSNIASALLPITSLQPLRFHAITHSFVQRRTNVPTILNSLRTLSIVTGVYPSTFPSSDFQTSRHAKSLCLHRLAASLSSLCTLFCTRFLCFQSFGASFHKTPGVGYLARASALCVDSALSAPQRCHSLSNLPVLCFHTLTNPFSRNSFLFTSMQNPRGCAYPLPAFLFVSGVLDEPTL